MFCDYFFTQLYGPSYVKQILDGVKNSNDSTETDTTIFPLYSKAANTQWWFVKREKLKEAMWLRQLLTADWLPAKNVSHEAVKCRAYTGVLTIDFK